MDLRLCESVRNGEIEKVKCLLNCGGRITAKDCNDSNLLHIAVMDRHFECIKFLIDTAPQLSLEKNCSGRTPLLCACKPIVYLDIIQLFVQKCKDSINIPDDDAQRTPLHYVAADSNILESLQATKLFLDFGADINAIDSKGLSVLHVAIRYGNTEIVELLLERGAVTSVADFMQVDIYFYWSILRILLEFEPSAINTKNRDGYTLLMRVCRYGRADNVQELLSLGADYSAISERGNTALMEAVQSRNVETVSLLLNAGADPTVENKEGRNAISMACACDHSAIEILTLLIQHNAFTSKLYTFNYPEVHPQTIVLREKRSPELLKFIISAGLGDPNLTVHEDFVNEKLLKKFDSTNMNLGPISYLLQNPETHLITDHTNLELLEILLSHGYPINNENGCIPPLTILLSCPFKEISNLHIFSCMCQMLLKKGASVSDMSLNVVCSNEKWRTIEIVRQDTLLPDALLMSVLAKNDVTTSDLMHNWSAPPLTLFLLIKRSLIKGLVRTYSTLAQYQLPLGTRVCNLLTEMFLALQEPQPSASTSNDDEEQIESPVPGNQVALEKISQHFKEMTASPPSLTVLSRFAVRAAFAQKALNTPISLSDWLSSVSPPGLRDVLMIGKLEEIRIWRNNLTNGGNYEMVVDLATLRDLTMGI